ncbi:hypothetical protein [Streptomyces sp. NPDC050287]|uniref:hypothetical protein n=1 Tax=Streptomyces sp. NPDC050287 TaxID=3365608 RepID=UPI003792567D
MRGGRFPYSSRAGASRPAVRPTAKTVSGGGDGGLRCGEGGAAARLPGPRPPGDLLVGVAGGRLGRVDARKWYWSVPKVPQAV